MSKHNKENNKVVWLQIFKNKMLQVLGPSEILSATSLTPKFPLLLEGAAPPAGNFLGGKK